ncbi:MAG: tetratricopeptide repeat protein, partial [Candidatus Aenigmatarchaeota archaeon]
MIRVQKSHLIVLFSISIILSSLTYSRNLIWKDEVTLWEDVVAKSPNKVRSHSILGHAYRKHGYIIDSIKAYQQALKLNQSDFSINGEVYYHLAIIHKNKGEHDKAQIYIDLAIDNLQTAVISTQDATCYHILGLLFLEKGLLDKALENFQMALELEPQLIEAYNNIGVIYARKGLNQEAIKNYQMAINLEPNFVEAHFNLGMVYLGIGA